MNYRLVGNELLSIGDQYFGRFLFLCLDELETPMKAFNKGLLGVNLSLG